MRLDTANRSFLALAIVGLFLSMYALCGVLAGGLVTLVLSQVSDRGLAGVFGNASLLPAWGSLSAMAIGLGVGAHTFLRQIRSSHRLAKRVRDLQIASTPSLQPTVARACLQGRVLLLDTPERLSFTYGMFTPRVAVTRGLLESVSVEELRAVLEHERYHVRNLDPLKVMLVQMITSTFFFLPALRSLRSRYVAGRELAADRRAMWTCGSLPVAGALLKVIRGPAWEEVTLAGAAMAQPGLLDVRVRQLESGREPELSKLSVARVAISLAAATLLALASLASALHGAPMSMRHPTAPRLVAGAVLEALYCAAPVGGAAAVAYFALARRARRRL